MSQSIPFTYSGIEYVIDLTNEEATEFEKMLNPYLKAATRAGGRRRSARRRPTSKI